LSAEAFGEGGSDIRVYLLEGGRRRVYVQPLD
jgi:hypothetical protein